MEIQIISGFLGTGKTTFLNKYLPLLSGLTAVVENEFGEVGLDGALLHNDIPVKELSAGCICCSLALDLKEGIVEIANKYKPDRILIEPSGIGKLSDVISACEKANDKIDIEITKRIVLVDACDCAVFVEEFGQFYSNQIEYANIIFLSNVAEATEEELGEAKACIQNLNPDAIIYEGDFRELDKDELIALLERSETIACNCENKEAEADIMLVPRGQIFSNVILEENDPMTEEEIQKLLVGLSNDKLGYILRVKGIVPAAEGGNWHFDYTVSKQSYEKMEQSEEDVNRVIIIGNELNKREICKYIYSFGEETDIIYFKEENKMARSKEDLLAKLSECVLEMEEDEVVEVAQEYIDAGYPAFDGIMEGLVDGMNKASDLYDAEEYFVTDLLLCSDAMYAGLEILKPHLPVEDGDGKEKAVIGVVEGDTHDIGKNLVKILLDTAGYEMYDLGRDVPLDAFVEKAKEVDAQLVCMSTLMTTTMDGMRVVIEKLKEAGIRDKVKVMIGGSPISQKFADEIGADGYSTNAVEAVKLAERLLA